MSRQGDWYQSKCPGDILQPYTSWKWKGTLLCFSASVSTPLGVVASGLTCSELLLSGNHHSESLYNTESDCQTNARRLGLLGFPGRISQTLATRLSAPSYWALASPELFSDGVNFLSPFASLPLAHERHHQDKVSREGSCSVNNQSINELSPLFP